MSMISLFNQIATDIFKKFFDTYNLNPINSFSNPFSIDAYKQLSLDFDTFSSNFALEAYTKLLSELDEAFMHSKDRMSAYESKGFISKSLLTKFGYIHLRRRRYICKETGKSFVFLDRFLGLPKYARMDPFVIGDLCEQASSSSYSMAGRIVSKSIGSKIKFDDDPNKYIISRATARNTVLKASILINEPDSATLKDVKVLNVMLDEKFVASQFNNGLDHMIKAVVVFEDSKPLYGNRIMLTGKKVFASVNDDCSLLHNLVDYIYYNYDTNKLKRINFMGDGALWIKAFAENSIFRYNKDIHIKFFLDHFHIAQAVQSIVTNKYHKEYFHVLMKSLRRNDCQTFQDICNELLELNPHREETITQKFEYIQRHWEDIQNTFKETKYKCSMESNISHVFADIFTSRPKAYSLKGLTALLKMRLLKTNGYDLKKLYFDGLKNKVKEDTVNHIFNKVSWQSDFKYNDINIDLPILNSCSGSSEAIRKLIAHNQNSVI